ncbi:hypothetical protein BDP27DRAFT_1235012 [Rhodocollybia butyracea]|uniref:Uncharacterized protein n=1 Tax=Rhodocollybia butyracea TaxID=206335 RepID=A0A9P5PGE2_9AGAR|nr:hypothetical protein BDP27DRAFT_1235012 [Rhodocollybia butyracea]
MHLILNLASLFMDLWRGKADCANADLVHDWPWAVLQGDTWTKHGADVAASKPYLLGSFDRPPRNVADKITSGYKSWEWLLYLFGLGPGLLYGVLPFDVWQSFCKMVGGIRLIYLKKITPVQVRVTYKLLIEVTKEFKEIYVQRRMDRIHFVRQPIHVLSHLASETVRVGSLITSSQWTMENSIGSLTCEIKSDSHPYANLSNRCTRRSQINSLKSMAPSQLDREHGKEGHVPRGGIDLGDDYALLCPKAEHMRDLEECENRAVARYIDGDKNNVKEVEVVQWGRARLPNGQIARLWWKEKGQFTNIHMARNVKIQQNTDEIPTFGEVQFYFCWGAEETLAMVSRYSKADESLLKDSFGTLISCQYQGAEDIVVYPIKDIKSVVAMVPHSELSAELLPSWKERVFVVKKPGLDLADLGGFFESDNEPWTAMG